MTIEEKLDWVLDKVGQGGFYPYREKGSHMEIIKVINELYGLDGNTHPDFHKCLHEWEQLEKILFDDDKLVESDLYKYWVLTVKGKMFEGYVNRKNRFISEDVRKKNMEDQLRTLSFWVAVGTVGLLIWGIVQYILEKYCCCH